MGDTRFERYQVAHQQGSTSTIAKTNLYINSPYCRTEDKQGKSQIIDSFWALYANRLRATATASSSLETFVPTP